MNTKVSARPVAVPCRLKILHEVVTRFFELGRYEVSIPLCRLAVDDYEYQLDFDHPVMMDLQRMLAVMYAEYTERLDTRR